MHLLQKKKWHDLKYGIYNEKLVIRSIILLYDTRRNKDKSWKLSFKWLKLYQICNAVKDKSIYMLEKLDGSQLADTFASDRLKKFHPCQ